MDSQNAHTASGDRDSAWKIVEKLDEQRRYPRVPLNIETTFTTDTGDKFSADLINISPDGLQIRCSVECAVLIRPEGHSIDPLCINAVLRLPVGQSSRTLAARCQIIYLRMVDTEPRCVAGMRFVQLGLQSERVLNAFYADQFM